MKHEFELLDPFPVLGNSYSLRDYGIIDLDPEALKNQSLSSDEDLLNYIQENLNKQNARLGWGGYLEKRNLYQSSSLFQNDSSPRNIHLGIDIWASAGTQVFAPISGVIHSFAYNNKDLDYGYTLILKHETKALKFHTLYGHLSAEFFFTWQEGKRINKGEQIATIGKKEDNGGWLPHLHFQIIKDIAEFKGDYPGVCAKADIPFYSNNCPNPFDLCLPGDL